MDKIKFSIENKKEKIVEFQKNDIRILPYISENVKLELAKNYIDTIYNGDGNCSENYYQAKWGLIIGVLTANTNIDYDSEGFDTVVNSGLWNMVISNIDNYQDFIEDLDNIIDDEKNKRNIGSVIDSLAKKADEFITNISGMDLSQEGIAKLLEILQEKSKEFQDKFPNSTAVIPAVKTQKKKVKE
jgi:hypothetical protein